MAGGKTSLTSADVELFEQMGISDTLRGAHSTGVCAVYKPYNGDWFSKVTKAAADGYDFFRSKEWEETANHPAEAKGTVSGTSYLSKVTPKALFGHNRYATQGAINALNAHPFQHGHITLAHNGTLNNWKALEGAHQFTVDSEAVAYSVSQVGFEETLKKLNGAFTLIWLDSEEKTLNIIRNTQRPFFLAQTSIGDWFGASEEGLVRWILGRGKSPRTISRAFECEVGVQYIFDVSAGCVLKEERKHELPTFPVQTQSYSGGYYSGYGSGYGSRVEADDYFRYWPSNRKQAKVEEKKEEKALSTGGSLEERLKVLTDRVGLPGVKLGSEIRFEMVSSHPYPAGNGKAKIIGWLPDGLEFAEIQVHNIDEKVFADDAVGYGILVSGYIDPESNTITLILRSDRGDLQKTTFDHDKDEEQDFSFLEELRDELDETRELMSGERFSAHEWHKSHHNTCAMCNNPIPFEEIEVASIENGYCFCGDCTEAVMVRTKTEQEKRIAAAVEIYCNACGTHHKQNILDGNMTHAEWSSLAVSCQWKISFKDKFTGQNQRPILTLVKTDKPKAESEHLCVACDTKVPKSMMSISPDLCQTCSDRFNAAVGSATEDNGGRKTLANGMKVTPEQWRKMCTCGQCGSNITWFFADKVKFNGSNPVCHSCKA